MNKHGDSGLSSLINNKSKSRLGPLNRNVCSRLAFSISFDYKKVFNSFFILFYNLEREPALFSFEFLTFTAIKYGTVFFTRSHFKSRICKNSYYKVSALKNRSGRHTG